MPPRLKSFELHGYKTFASRSEFQFSDGITAIVGPNGSGKSNIADALRWVLGEQSYGLLRGKKTEDMIFAGSENRPRAGMASATIVFDNMDGWLPIDFTEVGITRRAYRDGDNEYLLNGQRVRLKDISEVLAKSGLAERTYTIIGQGLVDAALALRAEERRRLFEEAAGIGLHRSRREEALKRLESTRRNLERVEDILAELQPRLRSLERQAKRAQEYNQLRDDLKVILREWYGYHWHKTQSNLVEAQNISKLKEEEFLKAQDNQHRIDQKLSDYRTQITDLREKLNHWHKDLTSLHQHREKLSRDQAVSGERLRLLLLQIMETANECAKAEEEAGIQESQLENSQIELDQLESELSEAKQSAADIQEKYNIRLQERTKLDAAIRTLQQNHTRLSTLLTQQHALGTEKENQLHRFEDAIRKLSQDVSAKLIEINDGQEQVKNLIREKTEADSRAESIRIDLQKVQEKLTSSELEQNNTREQINIHKTKIAQLTAESRVIDEAEKNLTGYDEGARILLQAVKDKKIEGAIGSLGSHLNVPQEFETAIAAVLGEFINALVLESRGKADAALDLINGESNRGSLFPLDVITKPRPLAINFEKAPVNDGSIFGIASELVSSDEKIKPVIEFLFGHVIVVKDRKTAQAIISSRDWRDLPSVRVVTLNGEIYFAGGPIIAGASGKGLLARPRQQREIINKLDDISSQLSKLENQFTLDGENIKELRNQEFSIKNAYKEALELEKNITSRLGKLEQKVATIQHEKTWLEDQKEKSQTRIDEEHQAITKINLEMGRVKEELLKINSELENQRNELDSLPLDEFQSQDTFWKTNIAVIEQALLGARGRQQDDLIRLENAKKGVVIAQGKLSQQEQEKWELNEKIRVDSIEEVEIANQIEELSRIVDPLETQLNELERAHGAVLSTDNEERQLLRAAEQQYTQAKINLAKHQESFDSIQRHIEDDFGLVSFDYSDSVSGAKPLPINGMVEELPVVETLSAEIEDNIRQQKAQIRRMGPINPEAQIEYQEVKTRFEFLSSQVNDLNTAQGDLKEVIAELDVLMEREFKRTFDAVALEFKQIFTRLFGGGSARLTLTEPENLSDTGIDIEARLPGRREQGLSLLSGGERSLTAVALIFALLTISPTPFCILDEVDAMLDEANVSRFRELLLELSRQTQFIVITHNRNTVQAASIIYGVTMGRDSASQVISLRMDELSEEFGV